MEKAATGAHSYGNWVVNKEATTTEAGSKSKTCSVCGDVVTEEIPMVETTLPVVNVTNPANNKAVNAEIAEAESSGYTLTIACEDTTKTYVYLVKYTDADNNVSEKIVSTSGSYSDGTFTISENAVSVTVKSALLGDADLNGMITADDATNILRTLVGLETQSELQNIASNVNTDGIMTADDATKILRVLVGLEPGF